MSTSKLLARSAVDETSFETRVIAPFIAAGGITLNDTKFEAKRDSAVVTAIFLIAFDVARDDRGAEIAQRNSAAAATATSQAPAGGATTNAAAPQGFHKPKR